MSHTPGPWEVLPEDAFGFVIEYKGTGDIPTFVSRSHRQANARLIAAAPDMKAALKVLTHNWDTVEPESRPDGITQALEALARAEGIDEA